VQTLIVLPTYQEADNVANVLRRVRASVPAATVLVVDDGSPDGTADLAAAVGDELGSIEVLRRKAKAGLGGAYRAGFGWGMEHGYDVMVEMDADLSHDPSQLPDLLRAVDQGADLAIGSRYVTGGRIPSWSWHRKALSAWANFYVNAILRLKVKDATAGFKAWRADTLRAIDLPSIRSNGYSFQVEMNYRTVKRGLPILEVPIVFEERAEGASKMTLSVQLESAITPWKLLFGRM